MNYGILFTEENEAIRERYDLAMERIERIQDEETVKKPFVDYFQFAAKFLMKIRGLVTLVEGNRLEELSLSELQNLNQSLYEDIAGDHYESSYANPAYAVNQLGNRYGRLFSFLYTELRGLIVYAYEFRLYTLTIFLELFIEIYNYMEEEDEFTPKDIKRAIYYFMNDYSEDFQEYSTRELLDSSLSFAYDIIMESNLLDPRYLYLFGEYITGNELKTAEYLNHLTDKEIKTMADTYTEGFRRGFIATNRDLSKKKLVVIRYRIGFERIVRDTIKNFEAMGLKVILYRSAVSSLLKRQHFKIGYYSTSPNRQYDYDHRFDIGLYLDKAFMEKKLANLRLAYEKYKELCKVYAGPSLIEVFGEELFLPEDKKEAVKLDKRQQKLYVDYYNRAGFISNEYLKSDEISFTIISYPLPEIGPNYELIFSETVKVNTLDNALYQKIQQDIIDELDKGEYVRVIGAGQNHTDMKVMLHPLTDPRKETIFENCVADVNIPAGEVFTSPVLAGTNGVLHVPRIFLNDLEYRELKLIFTDGKISDYSCSNFEDAIKNKSYIKENLMFSHDTLPIGEFAIGTNTTAYQMGRKYNMAQKLPVLIAEKTGPHFAVGDTCYHMSEEVRAFNPDGKEIIAKDNEISILRKTDPDRAYFNCHTDITLPYDEIKEIAVYHKDGSKTLIIKDARFVLPGTLELNKAFEE